MKRFSRTPIAAGLLLAACVQQAYADIAVIVSARSSVAAMTANEIAQIYLGKSTAMKPVDTVDSTTLRSQFYAKVAGKDEAQVKAIWSKLVFTGKSTPPRELSSSAEVVKVVAADPNVIGYVDKSALDSNVKIVYEVK
jgi:ABC-type phosphate transport system substrate-binding protein